MHGKNPAKLRKFLIAYEKEKHLYPIGTWETIQRLLDPNQAWQAIVARNRGKPDGLTRSINELKQLHDKAHQNDRPGIAQVYRRYLELQKRIERDTTMANLSIGKERYNRLARLVKNMDTNPDHYSESAIKTAKHALSLKGKMPMTIDEVIFEKTRTIKVGLWSPDQKNEQVRDIEHLKKMKEKWRRYFDKTKAQLNQMKEPADLKELIKRLD